MKRHVQEFGVKPWAGQDLLDLQSEPFKVLDSFFQEYGPCIIKGCEITPEGNLSNIAPGLVALAGSDNEGAATFKVVPFAGADSVTLPLYLTLTHTIVTRPYADKKVRPIAYDYQATATTVQPTDVPFLEITATGARRFVDAIKVTEKLDKTGNGRDVSVTFAEAAERANIASGEKLSVLFSKIAKWLAGLKTVAFTDKAADLEQDTTHRLVTDAEKTAWADKYTRTEVEQKIAAIVDSAPGTLDTLKELAAALGNDPNFATSIMTLIGGKADTVHAHTIANVTSLQSALDNKLSITREATYIGVRTGDRKTGQFYEFWDEPAGYADIYAGEFYANEKKVWHTGNFNPDNFVQKSGNQTIDGNLTLNSNDESYMYFARDGERKGYIGCGVRTTTDLYLLNFTKGNNLIIADNGKNYSNNKEIATTDQLDTKAPTNHTHAGMMKIIIAGHVSAGGKRLEDSVGPIFEASLTGDIYTVIHSRGNSNYHLTLTGGNGNGRGGHVYASLIEKGTTYFKVKTADDDSPNPGDFYFTMYEIV